MVREDTDLPFGDAFSPAQLDIENDEELVVILDLIDQYEGQPDAFDKAIQERFFDSPDRAENIRFGVGPSGYRIVDENFYFTDIGKELHDLRNNLESLYERFALHILRNLHGLKAIEIIEDLESEGRQTTNENIKQEFRNQYDFHINETSNHWSQIRAWLSKADIVNTGTHHYDIDRTRLEEILGIGSEEILELEGLNDQQQAFLRALTLINPSGRIKNSVVKQVAEEAYDVKIEQSGISRQTLTPLEEAGYIDWEHVDGKANWVEPTDKFDAKVLKPILDDLADRTGVPRNVLRQSFDDLLKDLDSDSTYEKGVALETLAVKLGRLLGLSFVGWRVRGRKTGGSEVDVIMDRIGNLYNRVQIQCKNTQHQLQTKHIAREVGISRMLQTNTVIMIARNGLSAEARQFANRVMQHENIAIMVLSGEDIGKLDTDPAHLLHVLKGESRRISNLKRLGEAEYVDDEDDDINREEQVLQDYQEKINKYHESNDNKSLKDFT